MRKKSFDDVFLIKNKKFSDNRGYLEILDFGSAKKLGTDHSSIITLNKSKGTIRGLHYQKKIPQSKIIKVIKGEIFDVFLNINPKSKYFMQYNYCKLNSKNSTALFIGKDYAHGYQTLTNDAIIVYFIYGKSSYKNSETIAYNDPKLKIPWPLKCSNISKKDLKAKNLRNLFKKIIV